MNRFFGMFSELPMFKKMFIIGTIFGLCIMAGCSLPGFFNFAFPNGTDKKAPDIAAGEKVNILFIGIDARPGEKMARSDTMILACVDPAIKKVATISIPRDTRFPVSGSVDKINSACALGGPEAAAKAVEELMGVDVDYYVLTNFKGFSKCVDILGGVTVDVEKRMYKPSEGINLHPGVQKLDGKQALAYCRFRNDALGDIGRTQRQQKFISALTKELYQSNTITKIPALLPQIFENVTTNMGIGQLLELAKIAPDFKPSSIIGQTLPGYFYNDPSNGLSYWIVDKEKLATLVADLFAGKKIAVVEDTPFSERRKDWGKIPSDQKPLPSKQVPEQVYQPEEPQSPEPDFPETSLPDPTDQPIIPDNTLSPDEQVPPVDDPVIPDPANDPAPPNVPQTEQPNPIPTT
ncbi:MAG: LCP family protein [Acidobacteriota bacterium]